MPAVRDVAHGPSFVVPERAMMRSFATIVPILVVLLAVVDGCAAPNRDGPRASYATRPNDAPTVADKIRETAAAAKGGANRDPRKEFLSVEARAAQGDATTQTKLARHYKQGDGVAKNEREAARLYELALDSGYAPAASNLATLYLYGRRVEKDLDRARELYEWGEAAGDNDALFSLGSIYEKGMGVPQDYLKAADFYPQAADRGDADAQANLARLYDHG